MFGRRKSKKQRKRETLKQNRLRGKIGEATIRLKYQLMGYEVVRTGKGSDFRIRRRDLWTGRVKESKLIEVKTGNAKLSKLQRKTKKKKSNYKTERLTP